MEREEVEEEGRGPKWRGGEGERNTCRSVYPAVPRGFLYAWDSYIKREAPARNRAMQRAQDKKKAGGGRWRGAGIGSARRTAAKRTRDR